MKIPANFHPQIPPRGTKEFALYAADTMRRWAECEPVVARLRGDVVWLPNTGDLNWVDCDYAILPAPEPEQITWPTYEQGLKRFADPRWQTVLVRLNGRLGIISARWELVREDTMEEGVEWRLNGVDDRNYKEAECSLDFGKTWRSPGWVPSLDEVTP